MKDTLRNKFEDLKVYQEKYIEGEINGDDLSDWLDLEISAELAKGDNEVDSEWLIACCELLSYVNREKDSAFPDRASQNLKVIRCQLSEEPMVNQHGIGYKLALSLAAVFVIIVCLSIYAKPYMIETQSPDAQQYLVYGATSINNPIIEAQAIEGSELNVLNSRDINEVYGFLSNKPLLPKWLPEGWELVNYYASTSSTGETFTAIYSQSQNDYLLTYNVMWVLNAEYFEISYEQDGEGKNIKLATGQSVYLTHNMERPSLVWEEHDSVSNVSGPISDEEALHIVQSIFETDIDKED